MASGIDPERYLPSSAVRIPIGLAAVVATITVLTLIGYAVRSVTLVNLNPEWQAMSVSTALLCLGLAAALWADARGRIAVVRWIGAAVTTCPTTMII